MHPENRRHLDRLLAENRAAQAPFLDLGNLGLTDCPEALWALSHLQGLNLGTSYMNLEKKERVDSANPFLPNSLEAIPPEIGRLTKLRFLCWSNQVVGGGDANNARQELIQKKQCGNRIKRLQNLQALKDLEHLDLSSNQINKIENLQELKNLQSLYLWSNQINKIENLQELKNLQSLHLGWNRALLLDLKLEEHPFLLKINLAENRLNNVPPEIAGQGNCLIDLQNWQRDVATEAIPNYEAKLILAGNGRVGKTCLLKRFFDRNFDPEEVSTHGIQLYNRRLELEKDEGEKIPLQINAWDFGGQEIYHATHRLFMQSRALYLAVWDVETEKQPQAQEIIDGEEVLFDNYSLPYWLSKARALSGDSPLLVVQNKIDLPGHEPRLPEKANQLQKKYKILDFISASAASERKFRRLRERIEDELLDMPETGMLMPAQWLRVKKALLDLISEKTIALQAYQAICAAEKLSSGSADTLLRYLHNTGVLFYQSQLFGNQVVLDQKWALEGIYLVFQRNWVYHMLKTSHGQIDLKTLAGPWARYSLEERKIFLSLMESCEVCFQIEAAPDNPKYLIPEYLPEKAAANLRSFWQTKAEGELFFEYQHLFFHSAFMTRFISKAGRLASDYSRLWKNGIWITHRQTDALIEAFPRRHFIAIRIRGRESYDLLARIHHAFKEIYHDNKNVAIRLGFDQKEFIDYRKLMANREAKQIVSLNEKILEAEGYRAFIRALDPEEAKKMEALDFASIDPGPKRVDPEEPAAIDLPAQRRRLKKMLAKDLSAGIRRFSELLAEEGEMRDDFLVIRGNYRATRRKYQKGTLDEREWQLSLNKIRAALIELADELEEENLRA